MRYKSLPLLSAAMCELDLKAEPYRLTGLSCAGEYYAAAYVMCHHSDFLRFHRPESSRVHEITGAEFQGAVLEQE